MKLMILVYNGYGSKLKDASLGTVMYQLVVTLHRGLKQHFLVSQHISANVWDQLSINLGV